MTDDMAPIDVRAAWRQEPAAPLRLSIEQITRRNRRVATDVRNFSTQFYVAVVFNVTMWGIFAGIFSGLARAGAILAVAGWAILMGEVVIHRRQTLAFAASMADLPAMSFYRMALERERAFHSNAARWRRLSAFVVGPLIFIYGSTVGEPDGPIVFAVVGSLWIGLYAFGAVGSRRRERALQRQIDDVDRELGAQSGVELN